MSNFNRVIITGYIGQDPETRIVGSESSVTTFSIAVTDRWKDGKGEKQERVNWFNIAAWNGLGENAAANLKKGAHVLIEGSLRVNEWEDKESGQKRSRVEIVASDIKYLNKKAAPSTPAEPEPPARPRRVPK